MSQMVDTFALKRVSLYSLASKHKYSKDGNNIGKRWVLPRLGYYYIMNNRIC